MDNIVDSTLEEKCEYLMNVVVESRKQFGKMCVDYGQKTSLLENKMLKLQLTNISNCRIKAKKTPAINTDDMKKELDEFENEILSTQKLEAMRRRVADLQRVVLQLKNDTIGQTFRKQITTDALLAEAKRDHNK